MIDYGQYYKIQIFSMLAEAIEKSVQDLRENELEVAMQRLEDLTDQYPYSVDLLLNKATICFALNETNVALKLVQQAFQIDPFDYRIHYNQFAIQWRQHKYIASYASLKKCLSLIYTLIVSQQPDDNWQVLMNRSLQLWEQSTASYALKIINLINEGKLTEASDVTKDALQKCIMKHHIYALCCLIDTKLNRQAEREQNAKDYHAHLLRPIVHADHGQNQGSNQEAKANIEKLIKQFNRASRRCNVGRYRSHQSQPNIIFMSIMKPTSINIEYEISKNSGIVDLACIKQDRQESQIVEKELTQNQEPNPIHNQQNVQNRQQEEAKYEIRDLEANNSKEDNIEYDPKYGQDNSRSLEEEGNQLLLEEIKQKEREWGEGSRSLQQNMFKQQKPFQLGDLNAFPSWMNDKPALQADNQKMIKTEKKQKVIQVEAQKPNKIYQKDTLQEELLYPITHPKFQVQLIMADLQINQDLVGKMDPYVYYQYGNQKHKTTIAKGQGLKPRWENQIKIFSLERNPTNMKVSVYDREVFRWDDLVGEGSFEVIKAGAHQLPIYLKGKKSGEVVFNIKKLISIPKFRVN